MSALVNGLLNFFIAVFTIITSPIQNLINQYFPALNDFASNFVPFFNIVNENWIPFIKDISFLPQWTWELILAYLIFTTVIMFFANVCVLID